MNDCDEKQLRDAFCKIRTELEKWGDYLDDILNKYVGNKYPNIKEMVQMKAVHRCKDIDSLIAKAFYRNKDYNNPLLDITDKVGTRLVLLCSCAVDDVSRYIESEDNIAWRIVEKSQDITKIKVENPEAFTYQSEHFIVKPCLSYQSSVDLELLTCEIQIRTLVQHAYSEMSHAFVYKQNKDADAKVRRELAASMAFLEEADWKFSNIYKAMNEESKDLRLLLTQKLNDEFTKLCNDYQAILFDRGALDAYFDILNESQIQQFRKEMDSFILANKDNIINSHHLFKDCFLFTQPTLILALYSFSKWQNFTKDNWPFTYQSLLYVVQSLGYSSTVL